MYNVFCIADDGSHFGGYYYQTESEAVEALTGLCDEGYAVGMLWESSKQDMLNLWNESYEENLGEQRQ